MSRFARRTTSKLIATSIVVVFAGCGSSSRDNTADTTTLPVSNAPVSLDNVTGELILTRQRDLIDRGLINVLVRNDSDTSMLMSDLELVADSFDGQPASQRVISVRSGRQVAIQVPYGVTSDCDTERPVTAELAFTFTSDVDPGPSGARVELGGADLLDTIRLEQCTTRQFDAVVRTRFERTEILDGTVVTRLVLEPKDATSTELAVQAVAGTILVGVRADAPWTGSRVGADTVTIPLTFVVNRCDPHALAEVTKRYALTLAVSADGAEPVDVAIDVDDLVADLEAIVDQCTAETTGG